MLHGEGDSPRTLMLCPCFLYDLALTFTAIRAAR